ncbi:hypothetical protein KSP40_PGU020101 [Platanthera guangdongensis]|uniref:Eukaryotic translation initiation factor 3 30 kDa subunit n=1 Tax=Platanthera guangdongensis TaxID=2320717 RepID=A0ABR2N1Y5_9ASPA
MVTRRAAAKREEDAAKQRTRSGEQWQATTLGGKQRLVEEADYKSTTELFAKTKKGDEKSLDNFIPKSESDFMEYAELLSHKIRVHERSYHYIGLLKAVMRLSMASLKAADAKEIASSVTAISNEKIKAEKEINAGKKKQGVPLIRSMARDSDLTAAKVGLSDRLD